MSTTRPADGLAASYPAAGETTNARTASIAGLEDTGIAFTEQVDTVCSAG